MTLAYVMWRVHPRCALVLSIAQDLGAGHLRPSAPKVETIPTGGERMFARDHETINAITHLAGK